MVGILAICSFLSGCIEEVGVSDETSLIINDWSNVTVEARIISIEANNTTVLITNLDVKQIKIHGDNNTILYSGLIHPIIFDKGVGTTFKTY
jgi:hypothetical protein